MKRVFKGIILIIIISIFMPHVYADSSYTYTITYDANGGTFENNKKTNKITHEVTKYSPRYSHTSNIDDTGKKISNYGSNWTSSNIVGTDRGDTTKNHYIKIDGASKIYVEIYYGTQDINKAWACMWDDSRATSNARDWNCSSVTSKYSSYQGKKMGGSYNYNLSFNNNRLEKVNRERSIVSGDSVTLGFYSDDSEVTDGYGYYAIVTTDDIDNVTGTYEVPTNSNSNLIFDGWYYDKNFTNKVNFDNITSNVTVYAKYIDKSIYEPAIKVVSGDFETRGSIIKIGDEEFYVIGKTDSTHVKLFAKYNLAVGEGYDTPTYKQDEESTGQVYLSGRYGTNKGSIKFADSKYWWDETNQKTIGKYELLYGVGPTDYAVDVYDDNASIKEHVDKYVEALNDQCVSTEGRLLTGNDLLDLGCSYICSDCEQGMHTVICGDKTPDWLKSNTYWIGSSSVFYSQSTYYGNRYVTYPVVMMNPAFGSALGTTTGPTATLGGVRPVIILDLSKGNTCQKELEPEEEIKEEVKGVEEIKENPKTGVFKNTLSIMVLLVLSLIAYNKVRHIQVFKRY